MPEPQERVESMPPPAPASGPAPSAAQAPGPDGKAPSGPASIDVSKLGPQELEVLYKQLVLEINTLGQTVPLIQSSIAERAAAVSAISAFAGTKPEEEMLVPISESTYVPGHIVDNKKVLVKLGGNYCALLDVEDAIEFEKGRIQLRKVDLARVKQAMANHQTTRSQIELELAQREQRAREASGASKH